MYTIDSISVSIHFLAKNGGNVRKKLCRKQKEERQEYSNLKTDYGRVKHLLRKQENIEELERIIEFNHVQEETIDSFSIDKIHKAKNFLSIVQFVIRPFHHIFSDNQDTLSPQRPISTI